jgi:hypothetical protein
MRDYKDRISKWLITHHGDSIVRLTGVEVVSWRPAQAEVVQPKQLPDGLLEIIAVGSDEESPFLIEVEAYPDVRHAEQMLRDAIIVRLDPGVWPDAITLVLRPQGQASLSGEVKELSSLGTARFSFGWKVVELWKVRAEDLLALNDVGLVPWALLADYNGPAEQLLHECREHIDKLASAEEHDILLTVAQVFATIAGKSGQALTLLGGKPMLMEAPIIQEILAEQAQKLTLNSLRARFGEIPPSTVLAVQKIMDLDKLEKLSTFASVCPDLAAFHASLNGAAQSS